MITINVISAHKKRKEYREKNYSGRYRMVEIVNDRPAYKVSLAFCMTHKLSDLTVTVSKFSYMKFIILSQRDEKTKYGSEVYLWYLGTDNSWRFSTASDFHARNNVCLMYNESQRKYAC